MKNLTVHSIPSCARKWTIVFIFNSSIRSLFIEGCHVLFFTFVFNQIGFVQKSFFQRVKIFSLFNNWKIIFVHVRRAWVIQKFRAFLVSKNMLIYTLNVTVSLIFIINFSSNLFQEVLWKSIKTFCVHNFHIVLLFRTISTMDIVYY